MHPVQFVEVPKQAEQGEVQGRQLLLDDRYYPGAQVTVVGVQV